MIGTLCSDWADVTHPVIGMLHLPPLPGSPRYQGDLAAIRRHVLRDAKTLAEAGVHGLMMENFGDVPFFPSQVPTHTVTHMTTLALAVRDAVDLPLGINVLRNDGLSALAIAHAVGASYIRVNVLAGACLTDQGIVSGIAADLMRLRRELGAENVKVLADVRVKHAAPLADRPLQEEVDELLNRSCADAVIVSGTGTGQPTDPELVREVKALAGSAPVLVGSGVKPDTVRGLAGFADGFIVGTSFKPNGDPLQPIDPFRVEALLRALSEAGG
ncbi:MAG: BtpA/SgcQ family protein [Phycisphaeraceae bacterium]